MRHRTSIALLAFGLLLPLGAAACSDDDDDGGAITTTSAPEAETTDDGGGGGGEEEAAITIQSFSFTNATVTAGSTVEVSNDDGTTHTVSSDDDEWEVLRLDGGSSGSFTAPSDAGTYTFHCDIHPTMTGTLTVQ